MLGHRYQKYYHIIAIIVITITLANIATDGNNGHITKIIEYGAIRPLCDLLGMDIII